MPNFSPQTRNKMCKITVFCCWFSILPVFFGIFGSVLLFKGCNPNNRNYCYNSNAFLGTVKKIGMYEKICKLCVDEYEKNCIKYNCYNAYVFAQYYNDKCVLFTAENEEIEANANATMTKYHLNQDVFWERMDNNECNHRSKKYYITWRFGFVLICIAICFAFVIGCTYFANFYICSNTLKNYGESEQQTLTDIEMTIF